MSQFTTTITITIIFIFTFTPLILAEFARNRALPSIEDFFVHSRNMSTPLVFFTIYGTWYSTFAVTGSSSFFYFNGPVYMTTFAWNVLFSICIFFIGRRIWFYGKEHGYITAVDFLSDIYKSKPLSILATIISLAFTLPYIQIQFSGGAFLIDIASDGKIPWAVAGFIFYVIMIVYLWTGGIRAVAYTDIFFGILVFITMLGIGLLLSTKAGGVDNIFDTLMSNELSSVTISSDKTSYNTILWLCMFIITPLGAFMSPPMWLRNYAVKDPKTFYIMPFLISAAAVCYLGCIIAGNAGRVLDATLVDSETLIPFFLMKYGGHIIITLFFCGLCAASLSTANSQLHALAAIYTIDIHKKYINKNISDKRLLYIAKWAVLGFSALTYILMVTNPAIIISTGLIALSGTAQLLVPTLGALFWKRSNSAGAIAGLIAGTSMLLILYIVFNLESSYCGVIGLATNTLIFIATCIFTKQNPETREAIVNYRNSFNNKFH